MFIFVFFFETNLITTLQPDQNQLIRMIEAFMSVFHEQIYGSEQKNYI